MRILVGYSGFIGLNLQRFINFDYKFNSKNLDEIDNVPDECDIYLCCLPATKWLINKNPDLDLENTIKVFSKIKNKKYNNVFLFSTIDVYQDTALFSDELSTLSFNGAGYSGNRYLFEQLVKNSLNYNSLKILRLPGLFGPFLKKNILFDIKNKNNIDQININSYYQWYNMDRILDDINTINNLDNQIINIFPEPVSTRQIIKNFCSEKIGYSGKLMAYNYQTNTKLSRYWYDANTSLKEIGEFLCN